MQSLVPAVCQVTIGRFHHFHLARQLEKRGFLEAIHTGYPRFKIANEQGLPAGKIHCFPWVQAPYMALQARLPRRVTGSLARLAQKSLACHVARNLGGANVLIALSGQGLEGGIAMQRRGGNYFCDRGSSHIRFQDSILREEYRRWGIRYPGIDARTMEREEQEYATADLVTVPSEFARRSFLEQGVPAEKVKCVPYGGELDRFFPRAEPDPEQFVVLFVGQVSLRKGFLDLLEAFKQLRHPRKVLEVIGSVQPEIRDIIRRASVTDVRFRGNVPNDQLPEIYSRAQVCVLPSIEDGFGMVAAEAMCCGCPVITTPNAGASDLLVGGEGGEVVPIRSPKVIFAKLEALMEPNHQRRLAFAARQRMVNEGGWDAYGARMTDLLLALKAR